MGVFGCTATSVARFTGNEVCVRGSKHRQRSGSEDRWDDWHVASNNSVSPTTLYTQPLTTLYTQQLYCVDTSSMITYIMTIYMIAIRMTINSRRNPSSTLEPYSTLEPSKLDI
jgi:hypothetical protein